MPCQKNPCKLVTLIGLKWTAWILINPTNSSNDFLTKIQSNILLCFDLQIKPFTWYESTSTKSKNTIEGERERFSILCQNKSFWVCYLRSKKKGIQVRESKRFKGFVWENREKQKKIKTCWLWLKVSFFKLPLLYEFIKCCDYVYKKG